MTSTCTTLAALSNEAKAQSGKHLTVSQAGAVVSAAARIQSIIGC